MARAWSATVTGFLLALVAVLPAPGGRAGAGPDQVRLLERLAARYRALAPFAVDFRQSLVSPTFGEEEQARGRILVGRGGRLAWRYDEPAGMRAVYDGTEWRVLDPEERELVVHRTDLPGREGDRLLADLLAGRADLTDLFAVLPPDEREKGDANGNERGRIRVRLLPREPRDDVEWVELAIDPGPPDLRRVVVVDPLGSRLAMDLGSPVPLREGLPPGTFEIDVPEGYTISRD